MEILPVHKEKLPHLRACRILALFNDAFMNGWLLAVSSGYPAARTACLGSARKALSNLAIIEIEPIAAAEFRHGRPPS
jgi:hypothetical protein